MPIEPYLDDKVENASALKRAHAHFDLAERAARFGYWRVELADGVTYWSPGMYRLLGVDPKAPPDSEWLLQQLEPEDRLAVEGAIATAIKARSPFSYWARSRSSSSGR